LFVNETVKSWRQGKLTTKTFATILIDHAKQQSRALILTMVLMNLVLLIAVLFGLLQTQLKSLREKPSPNPS